VEEIFTDGYVVGVALQSVLENPLERILYALTLVDIQSDEAKLFIDGLIEGTKHEG